MSKNEKQILQKAMNQIEVPQEESRRALGNNFGQNKSRFSKIFSKRGELILYSLVILCIGFIGTLLWPRSDETKNPNHLISASTSTSEAAKSSVNALQSTKYWKVKNEETYYSFTKDKVRIIETYFTLLTTEYTLANGQFDIWYNAIDENNEMIKEMHSYQVKEEGESIRLEPKSAEDKEIILEPHPQEIFPYTQETVKNLQPAVEPDLTAYSSWTSIIKGNNGINSTVTFDGFLRKEKIDGEERWLTQTYEIKGNQIIVNYGSYTVASEMYWDGDNLVLWPASNSLPSDDREKYDEEIVTLFKPNK